MTDRGHAAVELGLTIGLLLLPVLVVVTSFGPWMERRVVARSAAAEGAREAVLDLDVSDGNRVVAEIAGGHGLGSGDVLVSWCGSPLQPPDGAVSACPMSRGSSVTLEVRVLVPLVSTPWGDVGGLWVAAPHTEPIDLYRGWP